MSLSDKIRPDDEYYEWIDGEAVYNRFEIDTIDVKAAIKELKERVETELVDFLDETLLGNSSQNMKIQSIIDEIFGDKLV
jgi:hypothetical protein